MSKESIKYDDFYNTWKDRVNGLIVRFARRLYGKISLLCLDGPQMFTTTAFLTGFKKSCIKQIIVPEITKEPKIKVKSPKVKVIFNTSLMDVIRKLGRPKMFNVAFFDYMGSITGCRSNRRFPLEDMQRFLSFNVSREDGSRIVLACTFATRARVGCCKSRCSMLEHMREDFLMPLFKATGFEVIHEDKFVYARSSSSQRMAFFCFELKFDSSIETSDVKFVLTKDGRFFEGYEAVPMEFTDEINTRNEHGIISNTVCHPAPEVVIPAAPEVVIPECPLANAKLDMKLDTHYQPELNEIHRWLAWPVSNKKKLYS